MTFNTDHYEQIFNDFVMRCPAWANHVVEYRPKTLNAIRITLDDGTKIDYSAYSDSIHFVKQRPIESAEDISDEDCRESFSVNLANMMRVKGFRQDLLSERTGISTGAISKYMNRKATPSITVVKKFARALNCTPDELMAD